MYSGSSRRCANVVKPRGAGLGGLWQTQEVLPARQLGHPSRLAQQEVIVKVALAPLPLGAALAVCDGKPGGLPGLHLQMEGREESGERGWGAMRACVGAWAGEGEVRCSWRGRAAAVPL